MANNPKLDQAESKVDPWVRRLGNAILRVADSRYTSIILLVAVVVLGYVLYKCAT